MDETTSEVVLEAMNWPVPPPKPEVSEPKKDGMPTPANYIREATDRVIDCAAALDTCRCQTEVWMKHKVHIAQYFMAAQEMQDAWDKRTTYAIQRLDFETQMHQYIMDLYHKNSGNVDHSKELNAKANKIVAEATQAFKLYQDSTKKRRSTVDEIVQDSSVRLRRLC